MGAEQESKKGGQSDERNPTKQPQSGGPARRGGLGSQLQPVDEATDEIGFKEVHDRSEMLLRLKIQRLEEQITDTKNITVRTKHEIEIIMEQNEDIEKNKRLIAEKLELIAKFELREKRLTHVLDILINYEKALAHVLSQNVELNKSSLQ